MHSRHGVKFLQGSLNVFGRPTSGKSLDLFEKSKAHFVALVPAPWNVMIVPGAW